MGALPKGAELLAQLHIRTIWGGLKLPTAMTSERQGVRPTQACLVLLHPASGAWEELHLFLTEGRTRKEVTTGFVVILAVCLDIFKIFRWFRQVAKTPVFQSRGSQTQSLTSSMGWGRGRRASSRALSNPVGHATGSGATAAALKGRVPLHASYLLSLPVGINSEKTGGSSFGWSPSQFVGGCPGSPPSQETLSPDNQDGWSLISLELFQLRSIQLDRGGLITARLTRSSAPALAPRVPGARWAPAVRRPLPRPQEANPPGLAQSPLPGCSAARE